MQTLGKQKDSLLYWKDAAQKYAEALQNDYHSHRLAVIDALFPEELYTPGKRIYDFGCGDAVHFSGFLKAGAHIEGCDIAPEMIVLAKKKLAAEGLDTQLARVATVDDLKKMPPNSFDAVTSFNVLAYLTDTEEAVFYAEVARIVKPGGYLIVTHSNELFDMFSLNRYTTEFFQQYFLTEQQGRVSECLTASNKPENPTTYNVRENPLTYRYKLDKFGFEEIQQEFINLHAAPPAFLETPKQYPQTLGWSDEQRWKLMFQCSTYGSTSQKNRTTLGK